MEELVPQLRLSQELEQALVHRTGELGSLLNNIVSYEHGDPDSVHIEGTAPGEVRDVFLDAIEWVYDVRSAMATKS